MCKELNQQEMKKCCGGALSWLTILCIAGGASAVYKILFSGRGSINIGPFSASWGR